MRLNNTMLSLEKNVDLTLNKYIVKVHSHQAMPLLKRLIGNSAYATHSALHNDPSKYKVSSCQFYGYSVTWCE